jgi:TatD DNase family protein
MLIDTHCHLDFPEFDQDRDEVIKRARDRGIDYIINIGSSIAGSRRSLELSKQYDCIYAAIGIHPHEADRYTANDEIAIRQLAKEKKIVAIGEIGLDYYRNYSKAENQKALFKALLKLAKGLNLPLVIHTRDSQEDTLKALKEAMPIRAVIHCFSGDQDFLKECLLLGFFVSFTCNITYKKADKLRGLVKMIPSERLLIETDAPYLAPEEFRGSRNEPAYIRNLAEEIAKIKGVSLEEVARITTNNAKQFFMV